MMAEATGIRLHRICRDNLISCEAVQFSDGADSVNLVLRRAGISGIVEVSGEIGDYFADLLDAENDIVQTVTLDKGSYVALKNHWMRCKIQK